MDSLKTYALPSFGKRLKRLRRLRGIKQYVIAERLGVSQATVSRWESGSVMPDHDQMSEIIELLTDLPTRSMDGPLKRLIESSSIPVHLIYDDDHRLIAASKSRLEQWGVPASEVYGRSLWQFASDEIVRMEQALEALGWWAGIAVPPVRVKLSEADTGLRIAAGTMLWERVYLADGTPARICLHVDECDGAQVDVAE